MKQQLFAAASLLLMINATAQTPWVLPGNGSTDPSSDFVGTTDNFELVFRTDDLFRFRLNKTETYGTLGGFTNVPANGFALISPTDNFINNAPGPYTGLHLAAATNNAQQAGYRSNMGNGITLTGNNDQMYVGQLYNGLDFTDAAIVWSDNPGEWLADRLTFNFTSGYNSGASAGNTSFRGLQTMLIQPDGNGQEAYVGIGDFDAVSATPDERLDVLDGKVRIRQLPADAVSGSNEYVTVNTTTGVLEHRPLPPYATSGCEWNSDAPANKLTTATAAVGSNPGCPELDWRVGIGTPTPSWKLQVDSDAATDPLLGGGIISRLTTSGGGGWAQAFAAEVKQPTTGFTGYGQAIRGEYYNPGAEGYGVIGRVRLDTTGVNANRAWSGAFETILAKGTAAQSIGVRGVVSCTGGTTTHAYGLHGETMRSSGTPIVNGYGAWARGTGGSTTNYGVYAEARGDTSNSKNYGLYATVVPGTGSLSESYAVYASLPDTNGIKWAGYFNGKVTITRNLYHGTNFIFSDASLKTNVEEIAGVRERLSGLRPRSYSYTDEARQQIGLPNGMQVGFIAQEVEQVLPELISPTTISAVLDSTGQEVYPARDVKAVNYVGIIPLLVAGYQEQQQTIDALQEQLGQMQQALAACCANPDGSRMLDQGLNQPNELDGSFNGSEKLRIQPNPFNERTTVFYTLDRGGRTQLLANSSDGRDLRVLQEANLEAGSYQYDWNTAALAPGMYYVTLLLDGQPVVKKAVKVDR